MSFSRHRRSDALFTHPLPPVSMVAYLKFVSPYVREPLYFCFLQIGRFFRLLLKFLIICTQIILFPFRLIVWVLNFAMQFVCGLFRLTFLPFSYCWRLIRRRIWNGGKRVVPLVGNVENPLLKQQIFVDLLVITLLFIR